MFVANHSQAWQADYDYVATGAITQDGNGTLSYDLTDGNGKSRSGKLPASHSPAVATTGLVSSTCPEC